MRTEELRKRLPVLCDKHNLQWNETKGEFTVSNSEGIVIAYVDKAYLAELTTRTTDFNKLNDRAKVDIFKLLTEYALTPLVKREVEESEDNKVGKIYLNKEYSYTYSNREYNEAYTDGYVKCIENIKEMLEGFPETVSTSQLDYLLSYDDSWARTYHEKEIECDNYFAEIERLRELLESLGVKMSDYL